jgi:FkbM family methyltransferase
MKRALDRSALQKAWQQADRLAAGPVWRRWLARPLGYPLAQLWHKAIYPLSGRGLPVRARTFFGYTMHLELPAATDIWLTGGKSHPSERRLARFIMESMPESGFFLDIGAHVGFFSGLAHVLAGPSGRVLSIEATPHTFDLLSRNLQGHPGWEARNLAVADHSGQLRFHIFPLRYSEYNALDVEAYLDEPWYRDNPPEIVEVPALTLDELLRGQPRPDIIKVDAEGAEDQIVRGGEETLRDFQGYLVLEYIRAGQSSGGHGRAMELLRNWGYQSFAIEMDGTLSPCPDPESHLQALGWESDNLVFRKYA